MLELLQNNLVYINGLSSALANKNKLNKYEYLGQYGTIVKIVGIKIKHIIKIVLMDPVIQHMLPFLN